MARRRVLHPAVLAVGLALVVATYGWAGCPRDRKGHDPRAGDRTAAVEHQRTLSGDLRGARGAKPPIRIEVAEGMGLEPSVQAKLAAAARRFATTLVDWLYGGWREIDVEPVSRELRRELGKAPPYVPDDQIGSGEGEALRVQVVVQTSRSGVLVVVIRDRRTSYPIPASFERRAGRWLIVHLNTH